MIREVAWRLVRRASILARHPIGEALRTVEEAEHWSRDQLLAHRDRAVGELVAHCWNNVPYYRRVMEERRLNPGDFRAARDLAKFPYLTREVIRAHHRDLQARNIPASRCMVRRSGGTTGEPIAVRVDPESRAYETACFLRGLRWTGWDFGRPLVQLSGGSLGLPQERTMRLRARMWLLNQVFLPAAELGADNVERYAQEIEDHPGGILVGYASAVAAFAHYAEEEGITAGLSLRAAVCTADQLHDEWRARIGRVFRIPVFSYYGCSEIHSLGYEHDPGGGYLVPQEHVVMEVGGKDAHDFLEEGAGPIVCTALYNRAMPLLRYVIGDSGVLGSPAGPSPHQRIDRLDGRVFDYLEAEDGDRITGAFASHLVLVSRAPVWKWQVVQFGRRRVEFRYLTENGAPLAEEVRQRITAAMKKHLGTGVEVGFVVGDFEVFKSEKHRIIVRKEEN